MTIQSQQDERLPFGLKRILRQMKSLSSSREHRTRNSDGPKRIYKFDALALQQAKQDLDDLLTKQPSLTQAETSQAIEQSLNPLDEEMVQTFFSISRDLAQDVLKERDVMDINLRIAIVYASQERVNVSVAEDGFDLVLEWLRHEKLDTDDKREIGPRIIPRMIQQIFDEPDLSKDVFLVMIELCTECAENQDLVTPSFKNLFVETEDFLTQYCCAAITSLLFKSNRRTCNQFPAKFWSSDKSAFSDGIADMPNKDPVKIMQLTVMWNKGQGRKSWLNMISAVIIGNVEYAIVAGPSIDPHFFVAMLRNGSNPPTVLLDVKLPLLHQLLIDRKESRITMSAKAEQSAIFLDFRRTHEDLVIKFTNASAMAQVLKSFPKSLMETPDSQPLAQISFHSRASVKEPFLEAYVNKELKNSKSEEMEIDVPAKANPDDGGTHNIEKTDQENDISGATNSREDLLRRSSDLSKQTPVCQSAVSGQEAFSSSSKSVTRKVYRSATKGKSIRCPKLSKPGASERVANSTAAAALALRRSAEVHDTENDETRVSQGTPYDSVPPIKTRPQAKTTVSRKHINESDDEYRPTKKSRATKSATSKSVSVKKSTNSKSAPKPDRSSTREYVRRRSAPVAPSRYIPADEYEQIQDDEEVQLTSLPPKRKNIVKTSRVILGSSPGPNRNQEVVTKARIGRPRARQMSPEIGDVSVSRPVSSVINYTDASEMQTPVSAEHGNEHSGSMHVDNSEGDDADQSNSQQRSRNSSFQKTDSNGLEMKTASFNEFADLDANPPRNSRHESRLSKPIALPGRKDTPIVNSQQSQGLRKRDALDTLLEETSVRSPNISKTFRIMRRDLLEGQDESSQDHTPTPSQIKVQRQHHNIDLTLIKQPCPPANGVAGRSFESQSTSSGNRLVVSKMPLQTDIVPRRHSAPNLPLLQPIHKSMNKQTDQRQLNDKASNHSHINTGRLDLFHARLLENGIGFSATEALEERPDDTSYSSDSSLSEDGDLDSISNGEMNDERSNLLHHQQSVRDALADLTECIFDKLMRSERADSVLDIEISKRYKDIHDALIAYLNEALLNIGEQVDSGRAIVLKSWGSARNALIKAERIIRRKDGEEDMILNDFQKLEQKWVRRNA